MNKQLNLKDYMLLALFNNVLFLALTLVLSLAVTTHLTDQIIFAIGLFGAFLLNGFFGTLNFWPHLLLQNFRQVKPRQTITHTQATNDVSEPIAEIVQNDVINLVGIQNNPYIISTTKPKTLKLVEDTDDYKIYDIADFQFNLEYASSGLVYGSSGAGKSSLVAHLLKQLRDSHYQPKFIIADFGGMDWPDSEFKNSKDILQLFEWLHIVNRGRQLDGTMGTRIVVLLEEMQMFLSHLKLEDRKNKSKLFEEFILSTSQIAMTSRKTGACCLIGVLQNPKADIIPTELRENLPMVFGLRSTKNLASKVMGCSAEIAKGMPSLQPGVAYSHLTDTFFNYTKIGRPTLPQISRVEIKHLADSYIRRYGDKVLITEDENV